MNISARLPPRELSWHGSGLCLQMTGGVLGALSDLGGGGPWLVLEKEGGPAQREQP